MKQTARKGLVGLIIAGLVLASSTAWGIIWFPDLYGDGNPAKPDSVPPTLHGEINISGATLFADFFKAPASTNDFNDPDGDMLAAIYNTYPPDKLATPYAGVNTTTFWLENYRGVGSVNGLKEFLDFQASGIIPTSPPSVGHINDFTYSPGTTPVPHSDISLAILDMPVTWGTVYGNPAQAQWNRKPLTNGYGYNPITSSTNFPYQLERLARDTDNNGIDDFFFNTNTGMPDNNTLYDTPFAWVAVAIIANRGTGLERAKVTELQHLFVSGRMPSGENLVAATRTPGSGTRNVAMNSLGIDPAWGMGDNLGNENFRDRKYQLDPLAQPTNAEGSGQIEIAVQNWRLAVGYTGLSGASRAAKDLRDGKTEILDIMFDDRNDRYGNPGNLYIRPKIGSVIDNILDNTNPLVGYQIGGLESFVSRGDPYETNPAAPAFMENQAAADYLKNILDSAANFVSAPADPRNDGTPGEYLANTFFLPAGVDALPDIDPTAYIAQPTPPFNTAAQEWIRTHNNLESGGDTPPFGSGSPAGKVPVRNLGLDTDDNGVSDTPYTYTDGSGSPVGHTRYCYCGGNTIAGGQNLGTANRIQGDFDQNGVRNIDDADELVEAFYNPRGWSKVCATPTWTPPPGQPHANGNQVVNTPIAEVIGDFNGDGNLDKEDLRYFMDGLAIDGSGKLNRKAGAIAIDNAILTWAPTQDEFGNPVTRAQFLPWADTRPSLIIPPATHCGNPVHKLPAPISGLLSTGKTYAPGDFRGDVAGNMTIPGARPMGWDGRIDCADVRYVYANFGNFSNLNVAAQPRFINGRYQVMDLSADMNGDLVVNLADVQELVLGILGAQVGDGNLDGVVNAADDPRVLSSGGANGEAGGWCDGDYDWNGVINSADVALWQSANTVTITAAQSVKNHGATPRAVNVFAGATECRTSGPTRLVVTFDKNIQLLGTPADVTLSSGAVSSLSVTGAQLTIQLTGAANAAKLTVGFPGVIQVGNPASSVSGTLCVRVLLGDVTNDGNVNLFDLVSIRNVTSQPVGAGNFRNDLNADNTINILDMVTARNNLGSSVATCP